MIFIILKRPKTTICHRVRSCMDNAVVPWPTAASRRNLTRRPRLTRRHAVGRHWATLTASLARRPRLGVPEAMVYEDGPDLWPSAPSAVPIVVSTYFLEEKT
jgi:hypothetical protein